jgi:UDP-N-acetylglucosamine 2-epimerase (non-hydrolysing)
MKKILICFGTRPEAIKMLPLYLEFKKDISFETKLCVTGQHREMLDQVLEVFDVSPDYDLNIMKKNQSLSSISASIISVMDKIYNDFKPDMVFVHGDTATTLSISISAFYNKIFVSHVEAGLRTFNMKSPWPEEANRKVTSVLTDLHFAPTFISKQNLLNEGYPSENLYITGNTVIDALHLIKNKINSNAALRKSLEDSFSQIDLSKRFVLITGHRRENFGTGFKNICEAIKMLSFEFSDVNFVYPVHLNPNVNSVVRDYLSSVKNIFLIEPIDYESFIFLMDKSHLILTDSGGIQEEAPSLNKPVLVMRETTERPEGLEKGVLKLVGTSPDSIFSETSLLLNDDTAYNNMANATNPYGDGMASERILLATKKFFSKLVNTNTIKTYA